MTKDRILPEFEYMIEDTITYKQDFLPSMNWRLAKVYSAIAGARMMIESMAWNWMGHSDGLRSRRNDHMRGPLRD